MGIAIQCDNCGRQYSVADSMAGKRVKCRECAAAIPVPAPQHGALASQHAALGPQHGAPAPLHTALAAHPAAKMCISCGTDVSQSKRVKDQYGTYHCPSCWQAQLEQSQNEQSPAAAFGAEAASAHGVLVGQAAGVLPDDFDPFSQTADAFDDPVPAVAAPQGILCDVCQRSIPADQLHQQFGQTICHACHAARMQSMTRAATGAANAFRNEVAPTPYSPLDQPVRYAGAVSRGPAGALDPFRDTILPLIVAVLGHGIPILMTSINASNGHPQQYQPGALGLLVAAVIWIGCVYVIVGPLTLYGFRLAGDMRNFDMPHNARLKAIASFAPMFVVSMFVTAILNGNPAERDGVSVLPMIFGLTVGLATCYPTVMLLLRLNAGDAVIAWLLGMAFFILSLLASAAALAVVGVAIAFGLRMLGGGGH